MSATPSGVATPHPDPVDKRFPGILHSCFGQVGARPFTPPSSEDCSCSIIHTASEMGTLHPESNLAIGVRAGALLTAPSSPSEIDTAQAQRSSLHAFREPRSLSGQADKINSLAYPTPPASTGPSSVHKFSDTGEGGINAAQDPDQPKPFRSSARHQYVSAVMPLHNRRQTGILNPLSNITTNSSVHAAHLSNPTSSNASTTPNTPTLDPPAVTALSSLTSHLELVKLTDGVASPRKKNTPPLTPRASSNDGSESTKRPSDRRNERSPQNEARAAQSTSHASPPVAPPKGKLSVIVSEARRLRPSFNPYAVTVFEWIESVARPSKPGQADVESEGRSRDQSAGGVPIKRSGSDMGRSIAIPMKSRQSSTTSLSDQRDFRNGRQVTEPQWDHVALL